MGLVLHAHAGHLTHTVSTGAIVVAVLAALLALGCLVWGLARLLAFEPRWALSMRHAIAEAGLRTSAAWSELTDWMRLGH
jgi:cytochrome b